MVNLKREKLVWTLAQNQELRIEVKNDKTLMLKLRQGQAEIFGNDLQMGELLSLQGKKIAVYTWYGCEIEFLAEDALIEDVVDVVYEAEESYQTLYLNLHYAFQNQRAKALETGTQGPRIMIVGPSDVGKSTLSKIFTNYAVREGVFPTLVDLDIGQGEITVPGSISACPVEYPIDVTLGLNAEVPIAFYFGSITPASNPTLYRRLVENLAAVLHKRTLQRAKVAADGMIINTMGWVDGLGYDLLLHSIKSLQVDIVVVIGQDKLYSQLKNYVGTIEPPIQVLRLSRSEGVVARDSAMRKLARMRRTKTYFYGPENTLQPHSQTLDYHELRVFRIGGKPRAPTSALPLGATSVSDPLRMTEVRFGRDLAQCIAAVSYAESPDELLSANIAGFIYFTSVDVTHSTVTFLAPCPGRMPGKYLLLGDFKIHMED